MGYVNDYSLAQDMAQETFIKVWQYLPTFRNEANIIPGYFVLQPITACVSWNGRSKSYLRSFLPIYLKMKRRILSRRFSCYTSLLQNFRR